MVFRGESSKLCDVQAGVPQGSVYGPLLFLINVNDLLQDLKCFHVAYADDITIMSKLKNGTN